MKKNKIVSLADGYVDIKAYNENKELIYHDCGDNTVTDWMRQVIIQLLTGTQTYTQGVSYKKSNVSETNESKTINHGDGINGNGALISGMDEKASYFNPDAEEVYVGDENNYALYPTKVLFGTGQEFPNWKSLMEYYEDNNDFKNELKAIYDENGKDFNPNASINSAYSSTIGSYGNYTYSGGGELLKTITINDPNAIVQGDTPKVMARKLGVTGAVKTPYLPASNGDSNAEKYLMQGTDIEGKLLQQKYRGIGEPCFIYFDKGKNYDCFYGGSSIYVNGENNNEVNKITFHIEMPSQSGSEYYPYNGYTLRQVGLFNDSFLRDGNGDVNGTFKKLMPYGTMLAIKSISPFVKSSSVSMDITWTLTI